MTALDQAIEAAAEALWTARRGVARQSHHVMPESFVREARAAVEAAAPIILGGKA
jgi:hypothetical protein